jgi:hypothetical protein
MSFIQPWLLWALPLVGLPILIHLINQRRYQTRRWAPMMFLLQAERMNRGMARIRQWLILLLRTLAVLAFILGVCRPLASGFWSLLGTNQPDTTIVLMDRSPSMGERAAAVDSKLQAARAQLRQALGTIGSNHWVAIDSCTGQAREFPTLDALIDSRELQPSDATSSIPLMLQAAYDYIVTNQMGAADIWICSDLQAADWNADSGQWPLVRAGFESMPQRVRFSLLSYSESSIDNLSIRVTQAHCQSSREDNRKQPMLNLSLSVTRVGGVQVSQGSLDDQSARGITAVGLAGGAKQIVPVELELGGTVSQLQVELAGNSGELREHKIALPAGMISGWGRVSLPADSNNADNDFYFVFDSSPSRRIVIVSENPAESRPLEIAASLTAEGEREAVIEIFSPQQAGSVSLDGASLLVWHAELPSPEIALILDRYIDSGGQILFFPPPALSDLTSGNQSESRGNQYRGVRWDGWIARDAQPARVVQWRGDQDLLAATQSGAGLPLGQLEIGGFARLSSDQPLTDLANFDSGESLLSRLATNAGGVYFFTASTAPTKSSLAKEGVVLFVIVQRAIDQGQSVNLSLKMRDAGIQSTATTSDWTKLAGADNIPSTEWSYQAGVYRHADSLFAVNRLVGEDQGNTVSRQRLEELFAELPLRHVTLQTGGLASIVNEIWRPLLFLVLLFLLLEAVLCLPKTASNPLLAARDFTRSTS